MEMIEISLLEMLRYKGFRGINEHAFEILKNYVEKEYKDIIV